MKFTSIRYGGKDNIHSHNYDINVPIDESSDDPHNCVALGCFPPFYSTEVEMTEIDIYIRTHTQNHNTRYYFDNSREGHIDVCLDGIYRLIQRNKLNPRNCYFLTGALDYKIIYERYKLRNNISDMDSINILAVLTWEKHLLTHANRELLDKHCYNVTKKDKLLLCFNRVFRAHRAALLALLNEKNLVHRCYYSFTATNGLRVSSQCLSAETDNVVQASYTRLLPSLPLVLNNPELSPTNYVLDSDLDYYSTSYFSLVTETFFFTGLNSIADENAVFFSEKIFKPILCKHPFIVAGRPRSLMHLKTLGYKTFHPWINESYDQIDDDEQRLLAIVQEVERLSALTDDEWIEVQRNLQDIVQYNYNVMINKSDNNFLIK